MHPADKSIPVPGRSPRERPQGLENYEIGSQIARGGMGSILEAIDTKLNRTVAIKVMSWDADADECMRQRFLREAEVLAMLAHPNIVPIYDLVWDDGVPLFYSMKMVKGHSLQEILDALRGQDPKALHDYPLDRLLLIFRKVCDALAFAHSKGILHRDLKPENVMVGEFGEVLVMDWGLAKKIQHVDGTTEAPATSPEDFLPSSGHGAPLPSRTLQGSVMGTPAYMSPEQALGLVDRLDERSDIFSLGAILYAMLTLGPPGEGNSAHEILENVRLGRITPPASCPTATRSHPGPLQHGAVGINLRRHLPAGRLPPALSAIAMKALRTVPSARYPEVSRLSADIEAWQGGFAPTASEAGTLEQIQLFVLRHRVITVALSALLLISIGFVVKLAASELKAVQNAAVAEANEQRAMANAEESRRSLALARISVAEAAFRRADPAGMTGVLDGTPADLRDQSWQYLSAKRDSSLGHLTVEGFTDPVDLCAVPDQPEQFALANRDGVIGFIDVAGRRLLRTIDTGDPGELRFCFSGDGRRLLSLTWGSKTARLFDAVTGTPLSQFAVPDEDSQLDWRLGTIALDQAGDLAAVSNLKHQQIQVIGTQHGEVRWQKTGSPGQMLFHPNGQRLFVIQLRERIFEMVDVSDGRVIIASVLYPQSMALSPDGGRLALGLYTGEVVLLDAMTGRELRRGQLHSSGVSGVAWTSGGNLLTIGGEGRYESSSFALRLWEPRKLASRGIFFGVQYPDPYLRSSLNAASGYFLTKQSPPQLWRIRDQPLARMADARSEQGWSCNFLSDTVLLARTDFDLIRYDVTAPRQPVAVPPAMPSWHCLAAAHADSGYFALAKPFPSGPLSTVKLMQLSGGGVVKKWERALTAPTLCLDFDIKAERLLVVPETGGIRVLEISTGLTLAELDQKVYRAVFAGSRGGIAALERPRQKMSEVRDRLLLIDPVNGRIGASFTSPSRLNALAVSPDGRLLAVAGDAQDVVILDAGTLQEVNRFRAHDAAITSLRFHPDRPILATGSMDYSIKLWDYTTSRLRHAIYGLDGRPVMMSFSPNGRFLAVDGMEKEFRIYDLEADEAR